MKWLVAPIAALGALLLGAPGVTHATVPPVPPDTTTTTIPPGSPEGGEEQGAALPAPAPAPSVPLLLIPRGCASPPVASVVFVGRVIAKDYRVARFQIEQVRAGTTAGYSLGNLIDIRYGTDVQFLDTNEDYLVGAVPQGTDLVLSSKVREAKPLLGGNAVIGLTEKALACPVIEDPVRTFHVDGSEIEASMFDGLASDKRGIALAFAKPLLVVVVGILCLALIRWLFTAILLAVRRAAQDETVQRTSRLG